MSAYNGSHIKPLTTAPKTPTAVQVRDTFQTPNYAVDLLLPFIPNGHVWECAAGGGKITRRLLEFGKNVFSSDIRRSEITDAISNFIADDPPYTIRGWISNNEKFVIITNPPFSIKDMFIERAFEYDVPFAFLINADYHARHIEWVKRGCEKIIPNRRIDYITPTGRNGATSASQFHSMWLTYKFNLGRTETFVDLPKEWKKEKI